MFEHHIQSKLNERKDARLLRSRLVLEDYDQLNFKKDGVSFVNFSSNDYLGLAGRNITLTGQSGATASPLVVGRQKIHFELEALILDWLGAPDTHDCLLFSSGFAANTGVVQALFNETSKNSYLIQDKLNHASLMDAGKHIQALGYARQVRFAHNDMNKLQELVAQRVSNNTKALVVTEGVFSMDGDRPNLKQLSHIAKNAGAWWMLDDAHGIGIYGKDGAGSLSHQGVQVSDCDLIVITFGKAIGAQGAAVIAPKNVIDYLVNFSREYIYSTHLSPIQTQAAIDNIKTIISESWRREKLENNIDQFRVGMKNTAFTLLDSDSAIQPVMIGDEHVAVNLSEHMKACGYWLGAMKCPTVARGQARLRVTISTQHEERQIAQLVDEFSRLGDQLDDR